MTQGGFWDLNVRASFPSRDIAGADDLCVWRVASALSYRRAGSLYGGLAVYTNCRDRRLAVITVYYTSPAAKLVRR